MLFVTTIPALGDNFIYLLTYSTGKAITVDPGESSGVENILAEQNLELTHIFITHNHFDHTAGAGRLAAKTGCNIMTPGSSKAFKEYMISIGPCKISVIPTPGHTKESVCYYIHSTPEQRGILFTGDTLFVGGCGLVLTGDWQEMWQSLCKLSHLSDETFVYCGHDYTEENYRFALSVLPDDRAVKEQLEKLINCRYRNQFSVPSTIGVEKQTNIFLRAGTEAVRKVLKMENSPAVEVFKQLRLRKDYF